MVNNGIYNVYSGNITLYIYIYHGSIQNGKIHNGKTHNGI